jgi:L-iditol 2-dehydrogenase
MKALLVTEVGKLTLAEIPLPELRPYEALVRGEACGICNSTDHKLMMNTFCPGLFPTVLGHESVGEIVRVGGKVRYFEPGQRVLRYVLFDHHVPGGRSTWGGFSEYGIVVDARAMRDDGVAEPAPGPAAKQQIVPASISPAQAAAMITLKETLSCLQNFGVTPGSSVGIVGTGPVAQSFAWQARLLGAGTVAVFGRREVWRARFQHLSVTDYAVGDDWPAAVAQRVAAGGFDYVVEAVGSRQALSTCLKLAGANGRVAIYGVTPDDAPYDAVEQADPRVSSPRVEEADTHELMLRWVQVRKVNLDDWYTDVLDWTEFERGFDIVRANHAAKVILTM